ncbi:MAG: hypothetical protein ACK55Z_32450, partial [bacterium]
LLEQRIEERQREADLSTAEQETSRVNESPGLQHQDDNTLEQLQPLENQPSVQPPRKLHEDIHDLFGDQWPLQLGQMDLLEQRIEERQREADLSTAEQETSRVNESPGLQHQDKSPLQPLENQPPRKLHEDHEDQPEGQRLEDQPEGRQLHEDIQDLFGQMDLLERQREADQQTRPVESNLPIAEQVKIWKERMRREEIEYKRAEEQERREKLDRAAALRVAAMNKKTQELVVRYKELQERNRQAEKEAALLKEKKMADLLRKVLGKDGEK